MSCYQNEVWLTETEKRICDLVKSMGINRMPTRSEVLLFSGDNSLENRIMRSGGFKAWAERLHLKLKSCETYFGNKYEEITADKLRLLFDDVKTTPVKFPYDIVINNRTKIDVKASRLYKGKQGEFYTFNLESKYPKCDFYIAYCINERDVAEKVLVIPACVMAGKSQLSVGKNSIYDKYHCRWDLIKKFDYLMSEMIKGF